LREGAVPNHVEVPVSAQCDGPNVVKSTTSNDDVSSGGRLGAVGRAPHRYVLYLDFDGVLHHDAVYRQPRLGIFINQQLAPGRRLFEWAGELQSALEPYPDVTIVLSTTWVRVLGYSRARSFLPPDLARRVIGATFHNQYHKADYVLGNLGGLPARGAEVMRDVARRLPHEWVAVDDTNEGWPERHRARVVLCSSDRGLSDAETLGRLTAALARYFSGGRGDLGAGGSREPEGG
jgi:hypothetical protein